LEGLSLTVSPVGRVKEYADRWSGDLSSNPGKDRSLKRNEDPLTDSKLWARGGERCAQRQRFLHIPSLSRAGNLMPGGKECETSVPWLGALGFLSWAPGTAVVTAHSLISFDKSHLQPLYYQRFIRRD